MKLVAFRRYRTRGLGALLADGRVVDLRAAATTHLGIEADPRADAEAALRIPVEAASFLAGGEPSFRLARAALALVLSGTERGLEGEPLVWEPQEIRLGPPVVPPLIISTGVTYHDRLDGRDGAGREQHTEFYLRNPHQLLGPADAIPYQPWVTRQLDVAVRLAVVVGRAGRCVPRSEAMQAVYGYSVVADLTAQDQHVLSWAGPLFHMQYAQGKAFDGSLVLGPAVVSADEIPDLAAATARLYLDGRLVAESPLGPVVRRAPDWVAYLSEFVTLRPGMVIVLDSSTDTVVGVGGGGDRKLTVRPPTPAGGGWLAPSTRVGVEIEGVGRMESVVREVEARDEALRFVSESPEKGHR